MVGRTLFFLTVLSFILGQIARINFGNGVAITLLDLSVFLFVSYWAIAKIRKKEFPSGRLSRPIAIFTGACLLSLLVNSFVFGVDQIFTASLYLLRWMFYAGMYFAIKDMSQADKKIILPALIFAGVAHIIIGFFQYFFYPDLSTLYHLGWDEHLYRMFGSFLDPNYQGAFYVLLFILTFITAQKMSEKDKIKQYLLYFFLVFTLISIVLTYSRSALIMLFVVVISYAVVTGRKKIVGAIVVGTIFFVILFSNIYIEGLNPLRAASTQARISSMKEAVVIIQKHPIFGVGFNAYRYAQNKYGLRASDVWMVSHADAGTDNSYLFILATTGIVGLLAFGSLLKSMLLFSYTQSKKNPYATIAFLSLIGILVNCLFINSIFYTFLMYWLWVLFGVTERT